MTLQFEDGYFWNIIPQGIRFGLPEDEMEFQFQSEHHMILTTSTAFNFVPRSLADVFFFNLFNSY